MDGSDARQSLADSASEVGLMPRLRSLRVTEYQEPSSVDTRPSPRRLTSIPGTPGERMPLQARQGSNGSEFHRRLGSKDFGSGRDARAPWVNILLIGAVLLVVGAAAFYAGSAFGSMKSGRLIEGVGSSTIFSTKLKSLEGLVSGAFSSSAPAALPTPSAVSGLAAANGTKSAGVGDGDALFQGSSSGTHSGANKTKASGDADDLFQALSQKEDVTAATNGAEDDVIHVVTHAAAPLAQGGKKTAEGSASQGSRGNGSSSGLEGQGTGNATATGATAVVYASASDTLAALEPEISGQHLKVFVADLGPKYNLDILEAYNNLGTGGAKAEEDGQTVADLVADPFGPAVGEDKEGGELRATPPHSLDLLFYSLLLKSPLRVENASAADVILVPFWVHKLIKLDQELEKPNTHDLAQKNFWSGVDEMLPLLGQKPHLLVVPGQEAELRSTCGGFGLDFLCHPRAADFLVVTPEVFASRPGSLVSAKVAPGMLGNLVREGAPSLPVPDTTNVHFHENSKQWTEEFDARACNASKTKLMTEAFRARAPLRKALKAQCLELPKECTHTEPSSRHGRAEYWDLVWKNDQAAWFSLQPPGDTALQPDFYEALIAGAVPTIFDPKLPKILPFADHVKWELLLATVNAEDVTKQKKQVADLLKEGHTVEDRLSKLAAGHTSRHLFQYSLSPNHYLVRFDHADLVTQQDDAFTMALKAAMRALCALGQLPKARCSPK